METVEILVRIPKHDYNYILSQGDTRGTPHLAEALAKGSVLPKGHGNLIDGDALSHEIYCNADITTVHTCFSSIYRLVKEAHSIIEADETESEVKNEPGNKNA